MPRPKRTEIEYRNYNLPPEFPVLALSGDSWHISDVPSKRLHFHNCLEIGLCLSDHGTLKWENQEVEFRAGDVTCISRNVPHTTYSAPGESSLWSYLFLDPLSLLGIQTIAMLEREFAVQSMLTNCHILISPETDPQIGHLIQSIIDEINSRSVGNQLSTRGLILALLVHISRIFSNQPQDELPASVFHELSPGLEYIHAHYMEHFSLDYIAKICHLSPTHFRRLFAEQMGVNPLTFLHQIRVLESCNKLRSSGKTICDVANEVGYSSLSNYNRHFREIMGCTPTEWRKSDGQLKPSILIFNGWTEAENLSDQDSDT